MGCYSRRKSPILTAPSRIREIAYDGIGFADWGVGPAYFNFALRDIAKLRTEIPRAHFQLSTVRKYTTDRERLDIATARKKGYPDSECKSIFASVFSGAEIPKDHDSDNFLRGISREGVLRWLSSYIPPALYGRLRSDPSKT